jgi:allantoinase
MIIDNFEEMLEQAERTNQPLVMGIALHAYIVGQPFRLRKLRPVKSQVLIAARDVLGIRQIGFQKFS